MLRIIEDSFEYEKSINSLVNDYKNNSLVLLCGAGVSVAKPSCLPNGIDLKMGLIDAMVNSIYLSNLEIDFDVVKKWLMKLPLELILDSLVKVFDRNALKYLDILNIEEFNLMHYYLAYLATFNNSFRIITLNFDILIEKVLNSEFKTNFTISCPLGKQEKQICNPFDSEIEILKPHGSFSVTQKEETYENITTTVSEIRDRPDVRTTDSFMRLLGNNSSLLVIGYNGEDWDILPILEKFHDRIKHIYWVKHQHNVKTFIEEPVDSVIELLQKFDDHATLLLGNTTPLLERIVFKVGINLHTKLFDYLYNSNPVKRSIHNEIFFQDDKCRHATILAVASLLQEFEHSQSSTIFNYLKQETDKLNIKVIDPFLHQSYCKIISWWYYTNKLFDLGIQYSKEAIFINRRILGKSKEEIISDYLSTGYQYLSYGKPRVFTPLEIVRFFHHVIKGYSYLSFVKQNAKNNYLKAMSDYYKIDFLHNWFTLLLLFENRLITFLRKKSFRKVYILYNNLDKRYPDSMDREYFYLRRIEAEILSGEQLHNINEYIENIQQIEKYFLSISQLGHLRNICMTKALVSYSLNPFDYNK